MERILTERSEGTHGAPELHGMLTASVVGPEPISMDWILQSILSPPESEAIGFDNFPDFSWVAEKIEEWLLRIRTPFEHQFHPVGMTHAPAEVARNINDVVGAQLDSG